MSPRYCCYLLRSGSSRRTYIGITNNLRRRIRMHNGEIKGGASKTKRGRPWEMIAFIHGFQDSISALQFEWAWQNPTVSLAGAGGRSGRGAEVFGPLRAFRRAAQLAGKCS